MGVPDGNQDAVLAAKLAALENEWRPGKISMKPQSNAWATRSRNETRNCCSGLRRWSYRHGLSLTAERVPSTLSASLPMIATALTHGNLHDHGPMWVHSVPNAMIHR